MTRTMDPTAGVFNPPDDYGKDFADENPQTPLRAGVPAPGMPSHPEGAPLVSVIEGAAASLESARTLSPAAAAAVPDDVPPLDEPRERTIGVTTEEGVQTVATAHPEMLTRQAVDVEVVDATAPASTVESRRRGRGRSTSSE